MRQKFVGFGMGEWLYKKGPSKLAWHKKGVCMRFKPAIIARHGKDGGR